MCVREGGRESEQTVTFFSLNSADTLNDTFKSIPDFRFRSLSIEKAFEYTKLFSWKSQCGLVGRGDTAKLGGGEEKAFVISQPQKLHSEGRLWQLRAYVWGFFVTRKILYII